MLPNVRSAALVVLRPQQTVVQKVCIHVAALFFVLGWFAAANPAHQLLADEVNSAAAPEAFKSGVWPFRPLSRPDVPELSKFDDWARNAVDSFIGKKLEAAGIQPNTVADKLTLLRRVTYDLVGLAPTPAEQTEFLSDHSPDAFTKVVDRLLDSPRYGERWAQHWLDLVRYADTDGFKRDDLRPDAYRYRDYVVRSLNDDLPYDRFVQQQIAGDELEPENPDALVATGYLRLAPDEENASNIVQRRQETLDDITENAGLVFLGLTVGCARCHDHKFDAITQADYFRLQACFAAIVPSDDAVIASPADQQKYQAEMAEWESATAEIREKIDAELVDERKTAMDDAVSAFDPVTLKAITTPVRQRTCLQKQLVAETGEWVETRLARAFRLCDPNERKHYDKLAQELAEYDSMKPADLPVARAVFDGDRQAAPTFLLEGGDFNKPAFEVSAGFPKFLGADDATVTPPASRPSSTGRRSALARWLTRPDHPLTARVVVNRLWHYHFGQGIVATPNDFGAMGTPATHPELLDWLASELVAGGWRLKPIHRLMVLSAAYCQSAEIDATAASQYAAQSADPANRLLWHARRQRLDGESLRDALLQISGQLNLRMFGPGAKPALPPNLSDRYAWDPDPKPADRNRRSVYVLAKRNLRMPLLEAFDQPDMHNSCPCRANTTTAPQALEMLNGQITAEAAQHWSGKLLQSSLQPSPSGRGQGEGAEIVAKHPHPDPLPKGEGVDIAALIRAAYTEAYGRPADPREIESAREFIEEHAAALQGEPKKLSESSLPVPLPEKIDRTKAAAIVDFCHAVLCSNEFLYVD